MIPHKAAIREDSWADVPSKMYKWSQPHSVSNEVKFNSMRYLREGSGWAGARISQEHLAEEEEE